MRWLFLLLLVLNVFYYVWHQQEAPLRAKDVTPLNLYRGSQQDIRLLSETPASSRGSDSQGSNDSRQTCVYLGGFDRPEMIERLEERLLSLEVVVHRTSAESRGAGEAGGLWIQVSPQSTGKVNEGLVQNLSKEFNELKRKIMPCEGVAPAG